MRYLPIVVGLVVLAGCHGADATKPMPRAVSPTALTPSPAPSSAPPSSGSPGDDAALAKVPRPARAHTNAGAQAFAEFYIAQINKAWTAPDPAELTPYGAPTCKSCANYADTARTLQADRQRYGSPPFTLKGGAWLPESQRDDAVVRLVLVQNPAPIVNVGGATVQTIPRDSGVSEFSVAWAGDRWMVGTIKLVGSR